MSYTIKFTNAFKKNYKLMRKRGLDLNLLDEVIRKLADREPLEASNKDHALSGNFKGFRECHIKPDWLLIYLVEDNILTITMVNTGTHSDLLNM